MLNKVLKENLPKIVILGAGFAGVYAYLELHRLIHRNGKANIYVIDKNNYFLFTPLLHEVATGSIDRENIVHPIREILNCCVEKFYMTEALHIDLEKKAVATLDGDIAYDYLIAGLGAKNDYLEIEGAAENTYSIKELKDAVALKNHIIDVFEKAVFETDENKKREQLRIVIIGGGPTGVELAGELEELVFNELKSRHFGIGDDECEIFLINKNTSVLSHFSSVLSQAAFKALRQKRIKIRNNTMVARIDSDGVWFENGENLKAGTIVWTAGIKANSLKFLPEQDSLKGRIKINKTLQLEKWPEVFIVGDMACCIPGLTGTAPYPQTAQVAVQQGRMAAENVWRLINNKEPRQFAYKHKGDLVSVGQWMAVAELGKLKFSGRLAWLLWRGVYWSKMIGGLNKIKIGMDWLLNLFFPRDISKF